MYKALVSEKERTQFTSRDKSSLQPTPLPPPTPRPTLSLLNTSGSDDSVQGVSVQYIRIMSLSALKDKLYEDWNIKQDKRPELLWYLQLATSTSLESLFSWITKRGVICGFWSHVGHSGQSANIFSSRGFVLGCTWWNGTHRHTVLAV